MKKVNLKKCIFIIFVIMMIALSTITNYATEDVKETKASITAEEVETKSTSTSKTTDELAEEMKKGIVGNGSSKEDKEDEKVEEKDDSKEESVAGEESIATIFSNLELKSWVKPALIIVGIAIGLIIVLVVVSSASNNKQSKPKKVKPAKQEARKQEEVEYKQEEYEVYAKEENEVFDKNYEKAEASAYKTLEENGFELPNREEDDFEEDIMNSPSTVVAPVENDLLPEEQVEEKELTQEDKLNGFIKRIENKRDVQQGLFEEALPNANRKVEEKEPEVEEEESLLGFSYDDEPEKVSNVEEDDNESLLGKFEEEVLEVKEKPVVVDEPVIDILAEAEAPVEEPKVVEKEEDILPKVEETKQAGFASRGSVSSNKKSNRFSFIEPIPEGSEGAEIKLEEKPQEIGFKRKRTAKKETEEVKEEVATAKDEKVEEKVEEKKVDSTEIDFFAEMEANMKKNQEEREKNKK